MATRDTLKEAQELKSQLEQEFPNAKIIIEDQSSEIQMGRMIAEMKGFEIIEDDGGIRVTVKETRYEVLEVRKCGCGIEFTTAAIGEYSANDECQDCREKRIDRQRQELDVGVARESARVKRMNWRDAWEQS